MELLTLWWVWLAGALALAILEILAPGFIFLGFAIAAVIMAGLMLIPLTLTPTALLAIFGALSLISWIVLRYAFKSQSSDARIVTHDIND